MKSFKKLLDEYYFQQDGDGDRKNMRLDPINVTFRGQKAEVFLYLPKEKIDNCKVPPYFKALYNSEVDSRFNVEIITPLPQDSRFFWKKGKRVKDFYPLTLISFVLPFYPLFSLNPLFLTLLRPKTLG